MRPMGWGLLFLMACLSLMAAGAVVSAEVEFYTCANPGNLKRSNVTYQWEDGLTVCIIPDRDGTYLSCRIRGSDILQDKMEQFVSYNIDFDAGEKLIWEYLLSVDPWATPGFYNLNITVNYTDSLGAYVTNSFDYPIELRVPPFIVTSFVVEKGLRHTVRIRVETLEELNELDIWLGYQGPDGDVEREFQMEDVNPGNYTFEWMVPGSTLRDVEMHDYIYGVTGNKEGHWIYIVGPMEESEMEVVTDPSVYLVFGTIGLIVVIAILATSLISRRKRKMRPQGDDNPTTSRPV